MNSIANPADENLMSLREFLETVPASEKHRVRTPGQYSDQNQFVLVMPDIVLFCGSEFCKGSRLHGVESEHIRIKSGGLHFAPYHCRNCGELNKTYALSFGRYAFYEAQEEVDVVKIGEYPSFGYYAPVRTLHLVQPHADLFKKGLHAEGLGLGFGAFAYYREVVERQYKHFLEEVKEVVNRSGASESILRSYDDAIAEPDTAASLEHIASSYPQRLQIGGHNPLLLLRRALLQGTEATSDSECLSIAGSIRVILTEFANRLAEALHDDQELVQAIARLQRN